MSLKNTVEYESVAPARSEAQRIVAIVFGTICCLPAAYIGVVVIGNLWLNKYFGL